METETNGIDYAAVLADLRAKRAKLDAAITGIETMLGLASESGESLSPAMSGASGGTEVKSDSFFGMTIPEAAKKYLAMKKVPKSTVEITQALKSGGIQAGTQGNFGNTVGSVLNRNYTQGGGIVRIRRGVWGLAEWYPNKPRKPTKGQSSNNEDDNETADDTANV